MSVEMSPVGFGVLELATSRNSQPFLNALVRLVFVRHGYLTPMHKGTV